MQLYIFVSESGVKTPDDVKLLDSYGADAVLIGSTMMEAENILEKVKELVEAGKNAKVN